MEGKLSGEKLDHLVGLKWEVGEGREGMEKGAGIADWRLGKVEKGELVWGGEEVEGDDGVGAGGELGAVEDWEVAGWERSRGASRRLVSASWVKRADLQTKIYSQWNFWLL